ncbi:MAG: ribonuclease P protein component [Arenicellales bacterium]|jgi:ribonuclease P protein component|nr:ribonuclease P protein component [Arenicellales bacterium]|tara:strand:+ start:1087 stop:1452 length:366 start_codon:yes stop_codon:yes gene_type:complete
MECEGYAFSRTSRILHAEQFSDVFAARCGQGDATLSIQVKPNNIGHPRLGISVSKKVSSSAVKRNYIKRQIREWFRHQQHTLGGIDFIVVARRQSKDASVTTIHSALFNQWQIVKDKQCAE